MSANPPPGWYPDPYGQSELRWWDGTQWTENVSVSGATPPHQQPTQPLPPQQPVYAQQPQQPWPEQQRGSRRAWWIIPAAVALAALAAGIVLLAGGGGTEEAKGQTVTFQEPTAAGEDPFTDPADVESDETVPVASGPFGGTGSDLVCDRELLIRSLRAQPDRLREWARVLNVDPTPRAVARYIRSLRPVTLTQDTRVTNHTFTGGRAVGFQAILQAGTAVLVDSRGIPRVRCRCGNPLLPEVFYKEITCINCPANYEPPQPCRPYSKCWRRHPAPPPTKRAGRDPDDEFDSPAPQGPTDNIQENPSASFSPSSGPAGTSFTLNVTAFEPNTTIEFRLTRPDGVVEDYTIETNSAGNGSYFFPGDPTVITGTYTAVATNPNTGARAEAAVRVTEAEGGSVPEDDLPVCDPVTPRQPCREQ